MKPNLLLFFLILIISGAFAQDPQPYFERITTRSGLSHNKVNCLLQDRRGFIWMGTDDGLNRFDGEQFLVFRNTPGKEGTISGNIITDLLEDKEGIIWIATADGGLSRYDYRLPPGRQFRQFRHSPADTGSIPVNIINALLEDQLGYLWLASSGHSVLRFDKKEETFQTPVTKGTRTALSLCLDGNGIIWAGRQGGGLLKINPRDLSYEQDPRYHNLYAHLPHAAITALLMDSQQNMWLGSWDNVLYRYTKGRKQEEIFQRTAAPYSFANDQITSFAEDSLGRIWMGGAQKGLHVLDTKTKRFYQYTYDPSREGTIADDHINCVYIDRSGTVWIGTDKGISVNNPLKQQFRQTFVPSGPSGEAPTIYCFSESPDNDLWIGTSEGLYIQKDKKGALLHYPLVFEGKSLHLTCFFRDRDGKMYLGTDYSLFSYDHQRRELQLLPETKTRDLVMHPIIDSRVVSILKDTIDHRPVLLVSPYGHFLTYYDLKRKTWVSRLDSAAAIIPRFHISDNLIRKLVKTRDGTVYLATVKAGLGEWKRNPFGPISYFSNRPGGTSSLSNNIYDVLEDAENNLWLSTYGGGLCHFNRKRQKFSPIASSNNLTEGLAIDNKGRIWMISNGNLQCYYPRTKTFQSYNLPDAGRSGGVKGYIYIDSRGRFYVAGKGYFIDFHPDSVRMNRFSPNVLLTSFSIFNQSYSHLLTKAAIKLGPKDNYFTIGFSAPCFTFGNKLAFAYMLEGFDQEWIPSGSRREVSYSNLSGGTYNFRVKLSGTPGVLNGEVASIKIVVIPPFWKRLWFYLACLLLIAVAIYAVYRYRIGELLKRQAIRNRIAQDLHDNVGSTLSSISVYSQVAKIYKDKGQLDALHGTLEKISDASTEMISEMNDTVWAINPRNDHMSVILGRMESFARSLLGDEPPGSGNGSARDDTEALPDRSATFEFSYDPEVPGVILNMEKRKNFYLVFKEAINNAVKYADCDLLQLRIHKKGNQLQMIIHDNGKGFDLDKAAQGQANTARGGNGLANMRYRAGKMSGSLNVSSTPGKGTTVTLLFPIT